MFDASSETVEFRYVALRCASCMKDSDAKLERRLNYKVFVKSIKALHTVPFWVILDESRQT